MSTDTSYTNEYSFEGNLVRLVTYEGGVWLPLPDIAAIIPDALSAIADVDMEDRWHITVGGAWVPVVSARGALHLSSIVLGSCNPNSTERAFRFWLWKLLFDMREKRNLATPPKVMAQSRILSAIDRFGGEASLTQIARSTQLLMRVEREEALQSLVEQGIIEHRTDYSGTGGRPAVVYRRASAARAA